MRVSSNKILQKYDHPTSHYVVTLLSAQNLSDSNFPEAAISGALAVAGLCKLLKGFYSFAVMFIICVKERKIGRTIDKDSSFSKRERGKRQEHYRGR